MQKLRSIHLYLGCIFAPLLLFFAVSGIWQTLDLKPGFLLQLSTIHTGKPLKDGSELSSLPLQVVVITMAASFVTTTLLGVLMALRFGGSRRAALYCLGIGVAVPAVLVLIRLV